MSRGAIRFRNAFGLFSEAVVAMVGIGSGAVGVCPVALLFWCLSQGEDRRFRFFALLLTSFAFTVNFLSNN